MMGSCTLPAPKPKTAITFTEREVEILVERQVAAETRIFVQQLEQWNERIRALTCTVIEQRREIADLGRQNAAFCSARDQVTAFVDENTARIADLTAEIEKLARQCQRRR